MADYQIDSAVLKDSISAGANAAAASMLKAADAADQFEKQVVKANTSATAFARKNDDITKSAQALAKAQTELKNATAAFAADEAGPNKVAADARERSLDNMRAKVRALQAAQDDTGVSSARMSDAQAIATSRVEAAAAAFQHAAESQAAFNRSLGVAPPASDYGARAADIEAYGNSLDNLKAKFVPLFAVSKQYENTLNEIEAARKVGAISAPEAEAAQNRVTDAFAKANQPLKQLEESSGKAAYATRQLGIQSVQAFSGIATGQPILMTLIQQGHQTYDSMLSSGEGVKGLGKAVSGLFAAIGGWPTVAIGAAVVGAGLLIKNASDMADESRALDIAIRGVGRSAEVSATQLQGFVTALSRQGVSRGDSASIISNLARDSALSSSQIGNVTNLAPNVAAGLGTDAASAAKQVGDALGGSYSAITRLDDSMNLLTSDQRTQIRTMLEHGDRIKAVGIVSDELHKRFDNMRKDSLSPFQKAVEELTEKWHKLTDSFANTNVPNLTALEGNVPFSNAGAATPLLNSPTATESGGAAADSYGAENRRKEIEAQAKAVDDLTEKYNQERRVLAASVTDRARVRAEIEAEQQIRGKKLTVGDADAVKQAAVTAAVAQASDAAVQNAAAMDRQAKSTFLLADAANQGREALFRATTQQEAHEKALTQTGVSEEAELRRLRQLGAAQAALGVAGAKQNLLDQISATDRLSTSTSYLDERNSALENTVQQLTRDYRAKAAATDDPAIIARMEQEIQATRDLVYLDDQRAAALTAQRDLRSGDQTLTYLQAESDTLNLSADARARTLAMLQKQQQLERDSPTLIGAAKDAAIAQAGAIADSTSALQRQQNAMQEIGNAATQIADQIGSAITNAFISGQGAAVNWGNVLKGVLASVGTELVKLALINPILNSVTNGNRSTLNDVTSALGTGGGGSSGGSAFSLSNLSSVYSVGKSLYGGVESGSSFLNSIGAQYAPSLFNALPASSAAYAPLPAGVQGPVLAQGATGTTLSGALAGVGGGYAIGSLAGGFLQSSMGKTGPAPQIGAGVGAISGAIIGSVVPVIGTVIGGLVGGLIGGAGGGLIGPHVASAYSSTGVSLQDGQLAVGKSSQQIDGSSEPGTTQDVGTVNAFLGANGVRLGNIGKLRQVGENTPGGFQDPGKFSDLNSAFSGFRFEADNTRTNDQIQGKSFKDFGDLQNFVGLVQTTIPALDKMGDSTGSLKAQLDAIAAQFKPAIDAATAYGLATDDLAVSQAKALKVANDNVLATQTTLNAGLTSRYLNAKASISGSSADAQAAALYGFDASAVDQRAALKQELIGIYGDTVTSTEGYAGEMAALEQTLGEERLAIQKSYNDRITASATGSVTSLADYVLKLQGGSQSALSPQDQYKLASSQFDSTVAKAKGGDYAAYGQVTGFADTLLTDSRALNGSGAAYATDYSRVLSAISNLADVTPDTLTASVYTAETRTQTQQLVDAISTLTARVNAVQTAVLQSGSTPARVAA